MLENISFDKDEKYQTIVIDGENEVYKGIINQKAFSKTIENSILWEYLPDNGRVIEKDFFGKRVDLNRTTINDNVIIFYLKDCKHTESQNNIDRSSILFELEKVIEERKNSLPENSYTTHLFKKGEDKILKKLGEEAVELILASKSSRDEIVYESADLIYHMMVLLSFKEIKIEEILNELRNRML